MTGAFRIWPGTSPAVSQLAPLHRASSRTGVAGQSKARTHADLRHSHEVRLAGRSCPRTSRRGQRRPDVRTVTPVTDGAVLRSNGGTHAIAMAVLIRPGKVLLAHRHPGRRWYPNCWDLVGGHIEVGETPEDAVRRECREELGIDVTALRPVRIAITDPSVSVEPHAFVVTEWTGEPRNVASEEHDDLEWFTEEELSGLVLADALYPCSLARVIRDYSP